MRTNTNSQFLVDITFKLIYNFLYQYSLGIGMKFLLLGHLGVIIYRPDRFKKTKDLLQQE